MYCSCAELVLPSCRRRSHKWNVFATTSHMHGPERQKKKGQPQSFDSSTSVVFLMTKKIISITLGSADRHGRTVLKNACKVRLDKIHHNPRLFLIAGGGCLSQRPTLNVEQYLTLEASRIKSDFRTIQIITPDLRLDLSCFRCFLWIVSMEMTSNSAGYGSDYPRSSSCRSSQVMVSQARLAR